MQRPLLIVLAAAAAVLLAGCEVPGLDGAEKLAAARESEGKALGAGCRQAGRAIEDCYALNRRGDKAAIVAGWRDMNDYMRENKIEPMTPVVASQAGKGGDKDRGDDGRGDDAKAEGKAAEPRKVPDGRGRESRGVEGRESRGAEGREGRAAKADPRAANAADGKADAKAETH